MSERLRQIKKTTCEKLLYDAVYADTVKNTNTTKMTTTELKQIQLLKDKGLIREH